MQSDIEQLDNKRSKFIHPIITHPGSTAVDYSIALSGQFDSKHKYFSKKTMNQNTADTCTLVACTSAGLINNIKSKTSNMCEGSKEFPIASTWLNTENRQPYLYNAWKTAVWLIMTRLPSCPHALRKMPRCAVLQSLLRKYSVTSVGLLNAPMGEFLPVLHHCRYFDHLCCLTWTTSVAHCLAENFNSVFSISNIIDEEWLILLANEMKHEVWVRTLQRYDSFDYTTAIALKSKSAVWQVAWKIADDGNSCK